MNCSDFTSSNGNRNGKRNYGAANCGARTKQHHNSSTDFFRSVPDAVKNWASERGGVNELVPIFCGFVPILAAEPLWEPGWSSHSVLGSRRLRQRLRQQHDQEQASDRCPLWVDSVAKVILRHGPQILRGVGAAM
jgi:hypothetical protein